MLSCDLHRYDAIRRKQSRQIGILPVGSTGIPAGRIIMLEYKSLILKPVQSGRTLLINHEPGESLRGDEDDVISLEHPGILILGSAGTFLKILRQLANVVIRGGIKNRFKINVQDIGRGIHGSLCHGGFTKGSHIRQLERLLWLAGNGIDSIQPSHGKHAKMLYRHISRHVMIIDVIRTVRRLAAHIQQEKCDQEAFAGGAQAGKAASKPDFWKCKASLTITDDKQGNGSQ